MKKKHFFIILILIIIIDQIIKSIVFTFMEEGETRLLLGQFIKLHFVTNTGMAFSIRRK